MMKAQEVNFDGLVGPTHNYSGLSFGNVASQANISAMSNPKEAAKQGLGKMKFLYDLGIKQGVLLPQERPDIETLRNLGFYGTDAEVIQQAKRQAPELLAACSSASGMWAANSATISPSPDTQDGKVHITPANLVDKFHRSIEHGTTGSILRAIFTDSRHFFHHPPLPSSGYFSDEGAANHTRFCDEYGNSGVELFVYGRRAFGNRKILPQHFPARQTFEASQAVSRLHRLCNKSVLFAQQNPEAIDAGVFHNDVIAVGNQNVFLFHEKAFVNTRRVSARIQESFRDKPFFFIEVKESQVSMADAIKSYLFNSQLVTLENGKMMMIVPKECRTTESAWSYVHALIQQDTPIKEIKAFDLKQSMRNGGGPACLRLRVVLNDVELSAINQNVLLNDSLFKKLNQWVEKYYRDRILPEDLGDPQLLVEGRQALDALTQIMRLGSVYPFQLN